MACPRLPGRRSRHEHLECAACWNSSAEGSCSRWRWPGCRAGCGERIRPGAGAGAGNPRAAAGRAARAGRGVQPCRSWSASAARSPPLVTRTVSSKILARIEDVRVRAGDRREGRRRSRGARQPRPRSARERSGAGPDGRALGARPGAARSARGSRSCSRRAWRRAGTSIAPFRPTRSRVPRSQRAQQRLRDAESVSRNARDPRTRSRARGRSARRARRHRGSRHAAPAHLRSGRAATRSRGARVAGATTSRSDSTLSVFVDATSERSSTAKSRRSFPKPSPVRAPSW